MKNSTYVSAAQVQWSSGLHNLTPVTFAEALEDYHDSMRNQRIRAKAYRFKGANLEQKLRGFYKAAFEKSSAGMMLSFVYKNIPMDVSVDASGRYFRLCESY